MALSMGAIFSFVGKNPEIRQSDVGRGLKEGQN